MTLSQAAIEKRAVTSFVAVLIVAGGIFSFFQLGWLEDPDFSVKTAIIFTPYPGASAEEVESEVTDLLETALQEMSQVDELYSLSRPGSSLIRVDIKSRYWADDLPQVWDEMRSKIGDAAPRLPPGAGPPNIGDDFGFVYGFLMAVTGDGYSYAEMEAYAEHLQTQLGVVDGVSRVELWGVQQRVVYVDVSEQRLAALGLSAQTIETTLRQQNMVLDAGGVDAQDLRFRFAPTGAFSSPRGHRALDARRLSQPTDGADRSAAWHWGCAQPVAHDRADHHRRPGHGDHRLRGAAGATDAVQPA